MTTAPDSISVDLARASTSTGARVRGEISRDIFGLNDLTIKPSPPVRYDLHARRDGSSLVVDGHLEAGFDLECVRCLELFPYRVEVADFTAVVPVENERIIDLTDRVREDILLALPGYPRCEMSSEPGRSCPASGQFDSDQADARETGQTDRGRPGGGVWDSLDQLPDRDPDPDPDPDADRT